MAIVSILRQFGLRTAFSDNLITGFAGDTPVVSFTPSIVSFVQEEIDMDMDKTPITVLKTRLKKYADRPKVSNEAAVKAVTAAS